MSERGTVVLIGRMFQVFGRAFDEFQDARASSHNAQVFQPKPSAHIVWTHAQQVGSGE